nr:choice-of-anchor D domain-containing protein [Acidobacteriota bacterium]
MNFKSEDRIYSKLARAILSLTVLLFFQGARLASAQSCLSSSGSWANKSLPQTGTGTIHVSFDATPSSSADNSADGVSLGAVTWYSGLAAYIRFNPSGTIDVRNGSVFTAANNVPYSGGTTYHFSMDVNISTHTYNAYVMIGLSRITLGSNAAFRTDQASVGSLNNFASVDTAGTVNVCNIAMSAPPVVTTQPASQTVSSGHTATFSVAATGTAPMTYQWKKNGASLSGATSSTYTTSSVSSSDNGSQFSVTIGNSYGNATSNAATLTVGSSSSTSQLSTNTSNLGFGNVALSNTNTQNIYVSNKGRSSLTISQVLVFGAGFDANGNAAGTTLGPNQSVAVPVSFNPAATGGATGSLSVSSSTGSSVRVALSGTGVSASSH